MDANGCFKWNYKLQSTLNLIPNIQCQLKRYYLSQASTTLTASGTLLSHGRHPHLVPLMEVLLRQHQQHLPTYTVQGFIL